MKSKISTNIINWEEKSYTALLKDNYSLVVSICEKNIELEPTEITHYLYLGLAYLLNNSEELAQITWLSAISENVDNEATEKKYIQMLSQVLHIEACRQSEKFDFEKSWMIRQHLREINLYDVENILQLIILSIDLKEFSVDLIEEWNIVELLKSSIHSIEIEKEIFESIVNKILNFYSPKTLEVVEALSGLIKEKKDCANILLRKAHEMKVHGSEVAGAISKIALVILPDNLIVLNTTYCFYANTDNHKESIRIASLFYEKCEAIEWKVIAIYALIREKTRGGAWLNFEAELLEYKSLMHKLIEQGFSEDEFAMISAISVIPGMLQYYQDKPKENRYFQNKISAIFQEKLIQSLSKDSTNKYSFSFRRNVKKTQEKLRIGFLVSRLSIHSVGWLSRWLFQYYDQNKFDFALYILNQDSGDVFTQIWFESKVKKCSYFREINFLKVAEAIRADEIDILIDLDSTTSCEACNILALKPAPIQATWLGYDASGGPSIDYFIVDPYLLPENAQSYYSEKIWRLPQTYLAVDGFEIEVPTISRKSLDIPDDAIIYLSAQTGQKRNPQTIRLQMKILQSVENSYLLIKGWGDSKVIQDLFLEIAQELDIDVRRLRFLKLDQNEFIHRANLQVADVILDTYPYNGATTTLEALWVGVPIVTRVGQQCAARNSYTFLAQVGITDGIAKTDEEYIQWGICFGQDSQLRQKIYTQLRQSRQTSPLWNTKQFVRDMETAFEKMWALYAKNTV